MYHKFNDVSHKIDQNMSHKFGYLADPNFHDQMADYIPFLDTVFNREKIGLFI
jgi:hypothetical protein